jgi:hypothetical protein
MNKITEDAGSTKSARIPRPVVTDTSVTSNGEDLIIDGRIEDPGAPSMTVECEEDLGCVTVS